MEQQTPITPKLRVKPREGQKLAISPSRIGGMGGGGSRFVQECRFLEPRKPGYLGTNPDGLLEELYSPLRSIDGCSLASLFTVEYLKLLSPFTFWRSSPLR